MLALSYPARSAAQIPLGGEESLRAFLQSYEGQPAPADERTTRYTFAYVDLRDDGPNEVIVYLMGPRWCGSGGCTSLLLLPVGPSWKVMSKTTVTQLPIRVLSTRTHGWHDLGVWVQGGGVQPGYEARLRFNGKKYPSNPSVPPAQKLREKVEGTVVIPADTKGAPLW